MSALWFSAKFCRRLGIALIGTAVFALMRSNTVANQAEGDEQAKVLLESLPVVSGTWGKGRLLSTVLVNVVITDDGRVAVGSVVPEKLYEALAAK